MDFVNLIKTGNSWRFATEADLEDFVWANLKELFGLIPLKRQYYIKGQICDILALNEKRQLVVLELKNGEDRYIVQQLTRYYEALLENKPFQEEVDYGQPIDLIAITARFHRDNFTDRKYNSLSIEFLRFEILTDDERFYLYLRNIDNQKISEVEIHYKEKNISIEDLPQQPKVLDKILSFCNLQQQEQLINIREKVLMFDRRMQEFSVPGSIKYGKATSCFCAEIGSDSKGQPVLFLWLPLNYSDSKKIGRMKIWTDWENHTLIEGHVPKGIRTKAISKTEKQRQRGVEMKILWSHSGGIRYKIGSKEVSEAEYINEDKRRHQEYQNAIKSRKTLNELVDIALETWLKRL
ncbi:endonuclease NucS domain-containing protein [uncultured Nostoc sp.]|uniref:endonuclease NucS domain-containing protein n=2 Tax=Nostoc TaxID=1177 RepID=UPI0035CC92B5